MVASDSFAEFLREQLEPLGHITLRRMFGKTGVFCDGLMLGMVRDDTLYFRVDGENRNTFREAEAFPPLNYEKGGEVIDLAFWRAPERLFDAADAFGTWAARGAWGRASRGGKAGTGCTEQQVKAGTRAQEEAKSLRRSERPDARRRQASKPQPLT